MSTRGSWGFRINEEDYLAYNHYDSYPTGLGNKIIGFCNSHTLIELEQIFNRIEWASYFDNSFIDFVDIDWSSKYITVTKDSNNDFIKDSLFCEYAYIINLDTKKLEYYKGYQDQPDKENRFGIEKQKDYDFYPCKKIKEFTLGQWIPLFKEED